MSDADGHKPEGLERGLGLTDATMLVIGSMIGSGIFIVSAESTRLVGSPGWLLAAWALAGVLTITGALSCAELAAMWPRAGGQYVFLREAYGPGTGFLFGWGLFLVIQTGTIAAVAVAFASFLGVLVPAVSPAVHLVPPLHLGSYAVTLTVQQAVAVAMILLLTAVNTRGLTAGKRIQNVFTVTKTAALLGLIAAGLALGWDTGSAALSSSWWNPWANGWSPAEAQPGVGAAGAAALAMLLGRAMVGPLFAQSAWNNVTFAGGEVRDPGRNLPRALLIGCAAVVALYLLANLAYVAVLPLDGIRDAPQRRVGVAMMERILGAPGGLFMAGAILVSTFGCINGLILAGARVYYAMAKDGLFFERAGRISPTTRVPVWALGVQGVWTAFLTLTGSYGQLLDYVIFAALVFYVLTMVALFALRRKQPDLPRPYRAFGYPVVPALYMLSALAIALLLLVAKPEYTFSGLFIVLLGIPVYYLWRRGRGMA